MSVELKDSVIAFVDILGFKGLLESEEHSQKLLSVIKNIKEQNTPVNTIAYSQHSNGSSSTETMKGIPAITSFSDCIVLSIPMEDIKGSFDIGSAVNHLLQFIQQLADSLMFGGYILRGGITRGDLYHKDGAVFGKALIEAYELESTRAKTPRILVSAALAKEYNKSKFDNCHFLSKDDIDDEYYLDYLKFSFHRPKNRERYKKTTADTIEKRKKNISEKIDSGNLSQVEEDIKILGKWIHFEKYVAKALSVYEEK